MSQNFLSDLYDEYQHFSESSIKSRRFSHSDLINIINKITSEGKIEKSILGYSVEGREIFLIKIGTGKTIVLLWSQMHGDEATATSAFLDIFNFFIDSSNKFSDEKKVITKNLTLYFIPMLNPDGAEKFVRFNSVGIDINRDARALQSPEAKMLSNIVDEIKPDFAFNMHDQDYRWSVGGNDKVVALSVLAPAFDEAKTINESRSKAISLLSKLIKKFKPLTEERITRYGDDFEPRSFGDTIASKEVSTILIEAGRWKSDREKQFLRKLNFLLLLESFYMICTEKLEKDDSEYLSVPFNGKFLYDLVLRNVLIKKEENSFKVDIAINREEKFFSKDRTFYYISNIEAIGDLSTIYGIEEYDCDGLTLSEGKITEEEINQLDLGNVSVIEQLLEKEILFVKIDESEYEIKFTKLTMNLLNNKNHNIGAVEISNSANFILKENSVIKYFVLNGFLVNADKIEMFEGNCLIV
ncbi:MAG: M14 family zinc carboxypeptidase [Ignavibacteria bacterium]|nr:M14 family zinc carboxypeptidase [Ignavibacteria bacterium]